MRVGACILPQYRWPEAAPLWRQVEDLGFDHAWTYDHLAWRTLAGEPWFATIPTLTAAALATERIALGTFVASPNFRHPVTFAKDVMTLDDMSGGRLLLGLGAGGKGFDAAVLGQDELTPGQRVRRLDEFCGLLTTMLTQPVTDHAGEFYSAVDARTFPGPLAGPPPLLVAANGPRALDVAVRHGSGWVTTGLEDMASEDDWWAGLEMLTGRLDDALARAGRHDAIADHELFPRYLSLDSFTYSLGPAGDGGRSHGVARFEEMVRRAAALGFTDVVVHRPRPDGLYAGDPRLLEDVAALLPGLRAL